jgi:TIR domain
MPILINRLRSAATSDRTRIAKSLTEAKVQSLRTAFLCHSSKDNDLAKGLVNLLQEAAWNVYVDYEDVSMPKKPDMTTADKIKKKIESMDFFLFLATPNSIASRWCPWEIGYADGRKPNQTIWVVQTAENGTTYGNEYLDLYRSIDYSKNDELAVWDPGKTEGGRALKSS